MAIVLFSDWLVSSSSSSADIWIALGSSLINSQLNSQCENKRDEMSICVLFGTSVTLKLKLRLKWDEFS